MGCQQLHGSGHLLRIKTGMHVENAIARSLGQKFTGADVSGNHRLFHHAVGNPAWFDMDGDHGTLFIQLEAVIRLVTEDQSMFATPFMAGCCDGLQCL